MALDNETRERILTTIDGMREDIVRLRRIRCLRAKEERSFISSRPPGLAGPFR